MQTATPPTPQAERNSCAVDECDTFQLMAKKLGVKVLHPGGLGAGLVNLPYVNYFLHDLQTTMAHAHVAFPLAYGLPSMLMWVVAFFLVGRVSNRDLRFVGIGAIVTGIGFYMQVLVTLLPLGAEQINYVLSYGFWFAKSLHTPLGDAGFWLLPLVQWTVWMRMLGDITAGIGMAISALTIVYRGLARQRPL